VFSSRPQELQCGFPASSVTFAKRLASCLAEDRPVHPNARLCSRAPRPVERSRGSSRPNIEFLVLLAFEEIGPAASLNMTRHSGTRQDWAKTVNESLSEELFRIHRRPPCPAWHGDQQLRESSRSATLGYGLISGMPTARGGSYAACLGLLLAANGLSDEEEQRGEVRAGLTHPPAATLSRPRCLHDLPSHPVRLKLGHA
jgi:hypothetical protein